MIILMRKDTLVGIYEDTNSMLSALVEDMASSHYNGEYTIETLKL